MTTPTFFPCVSSHASSLLDLFLTTHPVPYSTAVLSPLGNSDHGVVEVRFRSQPAVAAETRTGRKTWHYGHADWEGLRDFFSNFTWRDEYIPHTVNQKIKAHRTFLQNPTVENRQAPPWTSPPNAQVPSIQRVPCTMREVTFRHETVRRVLLSLDINKASGPDLIPAIVLKRCTAQLAPVLSRLFQISYESGTFPENWKFAHTDPYNYRPIALLSVISKVMERCINRELLDYLECHSLITDRQYGFRHQSTGNLLAYVTQLWSKLIQSYGEAHVVAMTMFALNKIIVIKIQIFVES
ncbi:unnamed protein product [Acanthoscelides obtectus]|uniref:RNA-directed DNA polymerase from transposon X-element n=1 Tax=Acanthoscelides obtectus TaxID=200917 RepID=A0A9P0M324_ACAOB|nr:unnamed protein product [Acanthoscelides obtectus]CAK1650336.1 RNA-directed DNA polymerase from mobile element jockey [Acanthoscelides obtectus]